MENLKAELKKIAERWNRSGEYDDTEFAGRYFIGDTELDEFAEAHQLGRTDDDGGFDPEKIESTCSCQIIYDYEGSNENRQFGDSEIIFNETFNV